MPPVLLASLVGMMKKPEPNGMQDILGPGDILEIPGAVVSLVPVLVINLTAFRYRAKEGFRN